MIELAQYQVRSTAFCDIQLKLLFRSPIFLQSGLQGQAASEGGRSLQA